MHRGFHLRPSSSLLALLCLVAAAAAWVLFAGEAKRPQLYAASEAALRRPKGYRVSG